MTQCKCTGSVGCQAEAMDEHAKAVAAEFKLNADQTSVLAHCSRWAVSDKVSSAQEAYF